MATRYVVQLEAEERQQLSALLGKGRGAARRLMHARILLKADEGGEWTDERIAEALEVGRATVQRVRQRFVEEGLAAALTPRPHKNHRPRSLDGRGEAQLVALACSSPPEGRVGWTMQLLADQLVELKIVETISDETVRRTLKKKCAQAVAEGAVLHPAKSQRRLRLRDGKRP